MGDVRIVVVDGGLDDGGLDDGGLVDGGLVDALALAELCGSNLHGQQVIVSGGTNSTLGDFADPQDHPQDLRGTVPCAGARTLVAGEAPESARR